MLTGELYMKDIKTEVLISTMNIENHDEHSNLIKKMNINGKSLTINQCNKIKQIPIDKSDSKDRLFSYKEQGLSMSRNKAIKNGIEEICILADDDLEYVNEYEKIISTAYNKYKKADIIAFYVESDNKNNVKPKLHEGKISYLESFKIQSVQITFRRERIINKNSPKNIGLFFYNCSAL